MISANTQNDNLSIIDKYVLLQSTFHYEYKRPFKNTLFYTVMSQVYLCWFKHLILLYISCPMTEHMALCLHVAEKHDVLLD